MRKAVRLRQALASSRPVQVIGAHDGLGAKLAEEAGFDAVWASGLEISTSAGVPDADILTMTQLLAAASEMHQATRLPIVADCDTGFGNSNNVIHMVKAYEAAGIAAVCVEDKLFPKVNSFVPGRQELASVAEFVGKILAAKSAQESEDFLLIARVEALIAGWGHEEALRRAEAYRQAGADAILIHSKANTPDEILVFLAAWARRGPLVLVPTTYPQLSASEWKAAGADMVIYANQGLRAAIRAMEETYREILLHEGTKTLGERLVPLQRVFELQGMVRMKEQEKRYLRSGAKPARVMIPAGGDLGLPPDLAALLNGKGSRALLDLYGKPLVERQMDAFAAAGVQDVTLVGPFRREQIPVHNLSVVHSETEGMLSTICAGLAALPPPPGGATLVCYADILLGPAAARRLVQCAAPIGLLVDRHFRQGRKRSGKSLDYVFCDPPPAGGSRDLDPDRSYAVRAIGKHIDPREAHFEFIGLLTLDEQGHALLLERYARWSRERAGVPFGQAARFEEATLTDLLQELIDDGVPVAALEQDRGWMEIHDFEDYRAAIAQLGREGQR